MRYKQIAEQPKTFAIIMDTGDEILETLQSFAELQKLSSSSFKAIGALSYAKLGWFDWDKKKYEVAAELDEQLELLALTGDVALKDGKPQVHAHLVIGRRNGAAYGGHLMKAHVRPTCELILTENPVHLRKQVDSESGVALIQV